jgi:hypothetical protein
MLLYIKRLYNNIKENNHLVAHGKSECTRNMDSIYATYPISLALIEICQLIFNYVDSHGHDRLLTSKIVIQSLNFPPRHYYQYGTSYIQFGSHIFENK